MQSGSAPPLELLTGSERFEPLAFVGRGGSGLVYRVRDRETGGEVALKTLDQRDPEKLYRLKQEFRSLAGIRHPNLVKLYELHVTDQECFFTMEFVAGVDFVAYVGRDPAAADPAPRLRRFIAAARQLAHGLAVLHGAGKLHRDVKPPNVLVDPHGRVVLLDFGFATPFGPKTLANEQSEGAAGSLAYMAPEILWGKEATPASDWYSVGVVLYEALSGRLPFEGAPARLMAARETTPVPPLANVPAEIDALVRALLQSKPQNRPEADEILARVDAWAPGEGRAFAGIRLGEDAPFIGRARELARMRIAFDASLEAMPAILHVRGVSGIGKTELVRRFLNDLEREEVVVLQGRCHPHEAVPYRAFDGLVDSLSRFLTSLPDAAAEALVPRHAGALTQLFPVLGRVGALAAWQGEQAAELQEVRRRGFSALRELFGRLADRRRLVLWIDDAQWSDADSAALARELLRSPDPPPLLLVLSYRQEDRNDVAAFVPSEGKAAGLVEHEIDLGPLSVEDTRSLATLLASDSPVDLAAVIRETEGSPFFIDQLVRHLAASATGEIAHGAAGLSAVLHERLEKLSEPARRLLEVVAVAGRPVPARLALEAAGMGDIARTQLIDLQEERLLRSAPSMRGAAIEVYHDRIGDLVVENLETEALRRHHHGLAHALVREDEPDAQALSRHFLGAGEREPAARWTVEAALRSDRALAFTEAAELYGRALPLIDDEGERRELLVKRATALVNAGRGAEAAPLFLTAAGQARGVESLELRRRAAEQYLLTGRIDQGVDAMQALLRDVDLPYPRTTGGAAAATIVRLVRLAAQRPASTRFRRAVRLSSLESIRIETARSAAKGLAMVDPFRGLYFAVQTLSLALRSGNPHLIARELAGVGATLVPAGGAAARWAARLLDRGREMAKELGDPYLLGFTSITLAQKPMVEGRWREMLELCDGGLQILREHCKGVAWEIAVGVTASERALEELGDMPAMALRAEEGIRYAEETGDIYRAVASLQNTALCRIAQGRISEARELLGRARQRWTPRGFHLQHFYTMRAECYCDLFEGRAAEAWDKIQESWPALLRSNLLRHALIRTDAHLLRARAGLALALAEPTRRHATLSDVEEQAVVLAKQGRPDTIGHATYARAAIAHASGDRDAAASLLADAADLFAGAEMALCLALVNLRQAQLASSSSATGEFLSNLQRRFGVAVPESLAAAYAPGFP